MPRCELELVVRRKQRFSAGVDAFAVTTLFGKILEECASYQKARRHAQRRANDTGRSYFVARVHPYIQVRPTSERALRLSDPSIPLVEDLRRRG